MGIRLPLSTSSFRLALSDANSMSEESGNKKSTARTYPLLAADGAVLLLEKLSPALEQVDSSSGALARAGNLAIDVLVASQCTVANPLK